LDFGPIGDEFRHVHLSLEMKEKGLVLFLDCVG
jgi:hypothetical protein